MTWRDQYQSAYRQWQEKEYPLGTERFGWKKTEYPEVNTANGLKKMIDTFLFWQGHRSTRINTQGQYVEQKYKGRVISRGYRTGQTRKGTADISATINGKSVMFEIKVGRDKPSQYQLREQKLERSAGGIYEFISSPEQFLEWYNINVKIWKDS